MQCLSLYTGHNSGTRYISGNTGLPANKEAGQTAYGK